MKGYLVICENFPPEDMINPSFPPDEKWNLEWLIDRETQVSLCLQWGSVTYHPKYVRQQGTVVILDIYPQEKLVLWI